MHVGEAALDESFFHCRDMAGNGEEWTRISHSSEDGEGLIPPPPFGGVGLQVICLGQSYLRPEPFQLSDSQDFRLFKQGDPLVGFRVVVEPY
jgi:hypothetical protein